MPFKHNAARRHRIPRARYRIRNWRAYEAGLQRRGDLTLWVDEAAVAGWRAPRRSTPGGQPRYADLAIEAVLTQSFLANMLAVRRSGVTKALGSLQAAAVVDQRRGHVTICDRPSLEAAACGCYGRIQAFAATVAA